MDIVIPDETDDFVHIAEAEADHGISAAIIHGQTACSAVAQCCTRETHIRNIARAFIQSLRMEQIWPGPANHLPRLLQVEQGCAEGIIVSLAGVMDAVIEEQPALAGLDRYGTRTYLAALPGAVLEVGRPHHETVMPPILQIR